MLLIRGKRNAMELLTLQVQNVACLPATQPAVTMYQLMILIIACRNEREIQLMCDVRRLSIHSGKGITSRLPSANAKVNTSYRVVLSCKF